MVCLSPSNRIALLSFDAFWMCLETSLPVRGQIVDAKTQIEALASGLVSYLWEELFVSSEIRLPDGFEFCIADNDKDVEDLIEFNTVIHNELIAAFLKRRMDHLPGFKRNMNFFIRKSDTGQIISAISAIPTAWEYDGIILRNLELDCVGTHQDFRKRGFIRYLYQHFEHELLNGRYHISTLQGIPEFFRQFGYDFSLPLGQFSRLIVRVDQIPQIWSKESPSFMELVVRESKESDLDDIMHLYEELGKRLLLRASRTQKLWQIQESLRKWRSFQFQTKVITKDNGIIGYMRCIIHDANSPMAKVWGSPAIDVIESSIKSYDGVMSALYHLKEIAQENGCTLILLPVTSADHLSRIGLDLGGQIEVQWKHQIRVPNMKYLLETISPALERHLDGTMFEGITRNLRINTYKNCYVLHFRDGRLATIQELGQQPWGDISIREQDFVRLLLSGWTLDELRMMNCDTMVPGELKLFLDTLFPKGESFIHYYQC